jgi:hypothetical protein
MPRRDERAYVSAGPIACDSIQTLDPPRLAGLCSNSDDADLPHGGKRCYQRGPSRIAIMFHGDCESAVNPPRFHGPDESSFPQAAFVIR